MSPEHTFSLAALSHPTQTQTKKEKIMNKKKKLFVNVDLLI